MNLAPWLNIIGILLAVLIVAAGLIWLERRLLGLWQDRYGPNRVGPFGLLQVVADVIKIFSKEDWIPPFADKLVFVLAPAIIMATVLFSFVVIPFAPRIGISDLNIGLLFFMAMSSLGVYSVMLAGWSSNNKYSLMGGMRAAAQMLSLSMPRPRSGSSFLKSLDLSSLWLQAWPRRADCPSIYRKPKAN
jgi:NADH-quinone oxidoreductase subunit H